ncbi:MAG: GGDEF domain-containing protein [Clostridia bacterium]|nr:GGDEF domain-containing protein [Clostridia bacterium]
MEFIKLESERQFKVEQIMDRLRMISVAIGYILTIIYHRELNYQINYVLVNIFGLCYLAYSILKLALWGNVEKRWGNKRQYFEVVIDVLAVSFFTYATGAGQSFIRYFYILIVSGVALKYGTGVSQLIAFLSAAALGTVLLVAEQKPNAEIALEIIFLFLLSWFINRIVERDKFLRYKITKLSITDRLTGLYNYQYINEQCKQEIARANRYNYSFCIAMIDIDDFKYINDKYGHREGDKIIRQFGHIIKKNCRSSDIAARYGGDEFTIILTNTDGQAAFKIVERLRKTVEDQKIQVGGKSVKMSISAGVANYPLDAKTMEQLFLKADRALYKSKANGKNKVYMAI